MYSKRLLNDPDNPADSLDDGISSGWLAIWLAIHSGFVVAFVALPLLIAIVPPVVSTRCKEWLGRHTRKFLRVSRHFLKCFSLSADS